MNVLTTVLARAGSRGLANKHTRVLCNRPLIEYSIDQAKEWAGQHIVVCSDDLEVQLLAGRKLDSMMRCAVIGRPEYVSRDDTPKMATLRYAVKEMERIQCVEYDCIIDLDACNPLRTKEHIQGAFDLWREHNFACVYSVVESRRSPYWNIVEFDEGTESYRRVKIKYGLSRQEFPQTWDQNNSIFVYRASWLKDESKKTALDGFSMPFIMPPWSFVDIDDEVGFHVCEALMKRYILKKEEP